MGVKIYWLIVAAVIVLGILMPQWGWKIIMTGSYIFYKAVIHGKLHDKKCI